MYCPRKRRVNGVRFSHLSEVIFLVECIIVRELYDLNYGLHNRQFVKLFVFSPSIIILIWGVGTLSIFIIPKHINHHTE